MNRSYGAHWLNVNPLNPMNKSKAGFHWRYNVCGIDGPRKEMGMVCYTVNDFGDLVMVLHSQLNASLQ
jgi:hypothetical protein